MNLFLFNVYKSNLLNSKFRTFFFYVMFDLVLFSCNGPILKICLLFLREIK